MEIRRQTTSREDHLPHLQLPTPPLGREDTWSLHKRGSKAGVVDEGIGHEEEHGDDGCNLIQAACEINR